MIRLEEFDAGFFESASQRIKAAARRLGSYAADPGEENTHEARIAIRRLEAAYSVIPKPLRKKRLARFVKEYSRFFKMNSRVRDCDVMLAKLRSYGFEDEGLLARLTKQRRKHLRTARSQGESLLGLKTPKVRADPEYFAAVNEMFRYRCLELISEIKAALPRVTADESRMGELHRLRITVKKLRYLLELQSADGVGSVVDGMKALQKVLGRIHDSDMFVEYAAKGSKRHPSLLPLIGLEREKRHRAFAQLSEGAGAY